MTTSEKNFQRVQEFHRVMDGSVPSKPSPFDLELVLNRADFKIEEIVELVYTTAGSDREYEYSMAHLHQALDRACAKTQSKGKSGESVLVGQVDALIDLLYFTYGSFVLMGVDPEPIFDLVHEANMGKIWPDGKAHHDSITGKVLKPENWERDFAPEAKIKQELDRQLASSGNNKLNSKN